MKFRKFTFSFVLLMGIRTNTFAMNCEAKRMENFKSPQPKVTILKLQEEYLPDTGHSLSVDNINTLSAIDELLRYKIKLTLNQNTGDITVDYNPLLEDGITSPIVEFHTEGALNSRGEYYTYHSGALESEGMIFGLTVSCSK